MIEKTVRKTMDKLEREKTCFNPEHQKLDMLIEKEAERRVKILREEMNQRKSARK